MTSLQPSLPIREQPREAAKKEIANALLRLSALYQLSGFSEVNAFVLSDWILDNMKHRKIEIVLEALKNPPVLYENGDVLRNWRLNPDTVYAWVDKKAKEAEESRQLAQTREEHAKLGQGSDLSQQCQETIKNYLDKLKEGMFKRAPLPEMSPELKRINLMLSLLTRYKKENIDPITGKLYPDALPEIDWLLDKGYFIENGEIKDLGYIH